MNSLLDALTRYGPLTSADREFICRVGQYHEYTKHHLLIRQGAVCNYLYYIEQGLTQFYYTRHGRHITSSFNVAGSHVTALDSLIRRGASRLSLETLEPTRVIAFHLDDLLTLYSQSHTFEHIGRLITLEYLQYTEDRLYALQYFTARERYENFLAAMPDLIRRVPLTLIASYLGVTLETLSRIRSLSAHSRPN